MYSPYILVQFPHFMDFPDFVYCTVYSRRLFCDILRRNFSSTYTPNNKTEVVSIHCGAYLGYFISNMTLSVPGNFRKFYLSWASGEVVRSVHYHAETGQNTLPNQSMSQIYHAWLHLTSHSALHKL